MIIRCIAVDDEPMALDKLKTYIERIPFFELVATCSSAYDAVQVLSQTKVDAMFIDINMPDSNGLEFVKTLVDPPQVVFVTAYAEYAVDSYKVRAVDYLLKPYGSMEFQRVANNLHKQYVLLNQHSSGQQEPECLYLKVDYRYVRVDLDEIIYIEGMNEYLKVHTVNQEPMLTHTTFKQIMTCLPEHFLQVHRSYVVNMNHVKEIERSIVQMSDGTRISVSDGDKDSFTRYLQKYVIKK